MTTFLPITVSEPTLCTTRTWAGRLAGPWGTPRSGGAARRSRSATPARVAARRSSGSSESWVCSPASTCRPASIASSSTARQRASSFPPVGATPTRSADAPRSIASRSVATIGTSCIANGTTSAALRPACVESITATTSRVP